MMDMKTDNEFLIKFGERLRDLRQKAGLTQEKLAEMSGMDFTSISSSERGIRNITIGNVAKIAEALNVPPEALLIFKKPSAKDKAIQDIVDMLMHLKTKEITAIQDMLSTLINKIIREKN